MAFRSRIDFSQPEWFRGVQRVVQMSAQGGRTHFFGAKGAVAEVERGAVARRPWDDVDSAHDEQQRVVVG